MYSIFQLPNRLWYLIPNRYFQLRYDKFLSLFCSDRYQPTCLFIGRSFIEANIMLFFTLPHKYERVFTYALLLLSPRAVMIPGLDWIWLWSMITICVWHFTEVILSTTLSKWIHWNGLSSWAILESDIGGIITALPLACFLSSPEDDVCRACISISAFHMVISGGLCLGLFPCSCDRIVSVASVKVEYKREEQEQPPLQVRVQRLWRGTAACCSRASQRPTRQTPKTPKTSKP